MFFYNDDNYNDNNNLSSPLLLTPYDHNFFLTKYCLRIMFSEIVNKMCPLRYIFPKFILLPLIQIHVELFLSPHGTTASSWPRSPDYRDFTVTLRHTTLVRTPLDEWSAWHRNLDLTTHNTHKRQTSTFPAGFEPIIPASEQPQTHDLDCMATGIGTLFRLLSYWV
jgi:hypothetical protein